MGSVLGLGSGLEMGSGLTSAQGQEGLTKLSAQGAAQPQRLPRPPKESVLMPSAASAIVVLAAGIT